MALKSSKEKMSGTTTEEAVLNLIPAFLPKFDTIEGKAGMLLQILEFWREQQLSLQTLEFHFMSNLELLFKPLAFLLEHNYDGCELPLLLPFSYNLYLLIAKYELYSLYSSSISHNKDVSEDTLWSHIRENLEKDLAKRENIALPIITVNLLLRSQYNTTTNNNSLILPSQNADQNSSSEMIAFSCSHLYSRRYFMDSILPQFEQRIIGSLIPSLPATLKLLVAEYHQQFVNLACPVCVYNALLQETTSSSNLLQQKQSSLRPWEV